MINLFMALLLFIIVLPSSEWALAYLENRFPHLEAVPSDAAGIILLGGSFAFKVTKARHVTSYNDAAARIISFAELAHKNPGKKLVFSGRGAFDDPELSESYLARKAFKNLGLDTTRVIFEDRSKNTLENALFCSQLLKPKPQEKWVLVTSASHMPRAMGLFRHVGFNVIAYPVDYHTTGLYDFHLSFDLSHCFLAWQIIYCEYLSLARNYFYGRSDEWIPKPH